MVERCWNPINNGILPIYQLWLVVDLPLWKIWKSVGKDYPIHYGNTKNVWNHQPDIYLPHPCLMLDSTPTYHLKLVPKHATPSPATVKEPLDWCYQLLHAPPCCIDGGCPSSTHHWCGQVRGRGQLTSSRPWWKMEPGAMWMGKKNLRVLSLSPNLLRWIPSGFENDVFTQKMAIFMLKMLYWTIFIHIHWQNWSYISPNFLGDGCPCCKSSCGWSGAGRGGSSVDTASSCHSCPWLHWILSDRRFFDIVRYYKSEQQDPFGSSHL